MMCISARYHATRLIPDCGNSNSSAAHGAYIPLDHRTFLQWMSQWPRTQHKSGSASFGISTQNLLDLLEIPQGRRTAGTYRILARLMAELGWTAVRVRDLTRGGYKEQVRGCRDVGINAPRRREGLV